MKYKYPLLTYAQHQQRNKKHQKERKRYYYSYNLFNPKGTNHVLLIGDILTSYEQENTEGTQG